jgi:hypothetical protein
LITASDTLLMTTESQILADTNLGAAAGNISLTAPLFSVVDSEIAAVSNEGASGNAGYITIEGSGINLTAATILSDSNAGAADVGAAGEITIMGDTLDMSESTISTESNATSTGLPASIRIDLAQSVDADLSIFSADTRGDSAAGDITITAPQIMMSDTTLLSGTIFGATGDAGSVFLDGINVTLSGSSILSDTLESTGNGGLIQIIATGQAMLEGSRMITNTDGIGNAGNIFIDGSVINIDGSEIASAARLSDSVTATPLTGNAGTVVLNAGFSVDLFGESEVTTSTAGAGIAGDVIINTDALNITNSTLSSESTGSANSGQLVFNLGTRLLMDQSTLTTNSLSSQGGDIIVTTAGSEILLTGSEIKASAGSLGNGGNIILESDLLIMEHSDVLAEAQAGNGGFINILGRLLEDGTSRSVLTVVQDFHSRISADSDAGNSGTVLIEAPNSDIAGSIASQNADTLNVPRLASNRCNTNENRGRLSLKLAETLPPSPGSHLSVYPEIQGPQVRITPDSVIQSLACVAATR